MPFTGLKAELPLGPLGLTGKKAQSQIHIGSLIQSDNVTHENGILEKDGGATKYNSSAISGAPTILGGHDWHPTGSSTQRAIVAASDGKLYRDTGDGSFGTTLESGLTITGTIPVFVEGGKEAAANNYKLFIFTGSNQIRVLSGDGTTTAAIATPPSDWSSSPFPKTGAVHEGRLWACLGHTAYYSMTTNHENFTGSGSGSIVVYPGEGEEIVHCASFKGVLLIFKRPTGIYYVDTSDTTASNWRVVPLSKGIGMGSPDGGAPIDNDYIFMDCQYNIHLISAVDSPFANLGTRSLSDIQEMDNWIRTNLNLGQYQRVRCRFYPAKREVQFAVAGAGSTVNTYRLMVDFHIPELVRFRSNTMLTAESIWLKQDTNGVPRIMVGDNAGFVWNTDQSTRSKDGSGYTCQFQTPHSDLAHLNPDLATIRKNLKFLELFFEPKGNWDLNVDVYIDGKNTQTITFNMGTTGANLGSFILGTSKLAGDQSKSKRKRVTGSGKRISLVGRMSGAAQTFAVEKAILYFFPGEERE